MFEHRSQPLLPRRRFLARIANSGVVALLLVTGSLAAGMLGYHGLEGMSWLDAFLNAAMLLGGMGPVAVLETAGGKLFAGLYAIYCGVLVLVVAGVLLAPLVHRMLHKFHLEKAKDNER